MDKKHLCDCCKNSVPICNGKEIVWGIDVNPNARGAEADTVLKCDAFQNKLETVEKK